MIYGNISYVTTVAWDKLVALKLIVIKNIIALFNAVLSFFQPDILFTILYLSEEVYSGKQMKEMSS